MHTHSLVVFWVILATETAASKGQQDHHTQEEPDASQRRPLDGLPGAVCAVVGLLLGSDEVFPVISLLMLLCGCLVEGCLVVLGVVVSYQHQF